MMAMMGKGNTQQGDAASAGQPQPDSRAALPEQGFGGTYAPKSLFGEAPV